MGKNPQKVPAILPQADHQPAPLALLLIPFRANVRAGVSRGLGGRGGSSGWSRASSSQDRAEGQGVCFVDDGDPTLDLLH